VISVVPIYPSLVATTGREHITQTTTHASTFGALPTYRQLDTEANIKLSVYQKKTAATLIIETCFRC